jgi:HD-like signal output (HDOD) protein
MANENSFRILEDIARDLSGDEITFPTFLDVTFQIRGALKNPNLTVDQLSLLVGAEPLMSAKVIRLANSAALNPTGRTIGDVKTAITRVGMEAVRTISFAVAMEQLLGSKKMAPFEWISQRLWEHTIHVAALCRVLARKIAKINPDEAMFSGLVHDIGVFYLLSRATNFPDLIENRPELYELLVHWHDNIGHALLAALGLGEELLGAVLEHEVERQVPAIKTLADVLFVANKLANLKTSWRNPEELADADLTGLASLFNAEAIKALLAESEEDVVSLKSALAG